MTQPDINHSSGKDSKPTHRPCIWARLNTLRHTQTETLRGCMCVRRSSFEQKGHLLSLDDLWGSWGGMHSDESWLCPSSFLCPSCSTCMCCHQQSSFPSLYCMNAHTHTQSCICGLRGLAIAVMVFILYKLYVLLPYTYPTPKLSPHRRLCAFLDFQKKHHLVCFFKPFGLRGHKQCPHKPPSWCNTHVIIHICVLIIYV